MQTERNSIFTQAMRKRPCAIAEIHGSEEYTQIKGTVKFHRTPYGVLVMSDIHSLPCSKEKCSGRIFAFHIHSGNSCSGTEHDPFSDAMTHYNPGGCPHPYHAGDMPPLFSSKGYAFSAFLTDRFSIGEIIGKTVIIHSASDDFTTQPSGNSGEKIACGVIKKYC